MELKAAFVISMMILAFSSGHPTTSSEVSQLEFAIDMCIINCDQCFKTNKLLVGCANDCIRFDAIVPIRWKLLCPLLEDDVPSIKMI